MDETDDVVNRGSDHRISGVPSFQHFLNRLVDGQTTSQEMHLCTRHHDLREAERVGLKNLIDDPAFLLPEGG